MNDDRRAAGPAALLLSLLLLAGCGDRKADRRAETRSRALALAAANQPREAEALLRPLLLEDPTPDPEAARVLTDIYMASFHFNPALAVIERWIKDDPGDAAPLLRRGEIHARAGEPPDVLLKDYEEALRRAPESAQARLGLANALRLAQRNEEALAAYERGLAGAPDDADAHLGAARSAIALGKTEIAEPHLDRTLALDPKYAAAHVERAGIHQRLARFDKALADLDRAVELEPYEPESRYKRSLLLGRLGRAAEAKADQDKAERLRAEHARMSELRNALVDAPDDPKLQCEAARWLIDHGHPDEGIVWAKKTLAKHPGHPEACAILVAHYESAGEAGLANFYRSQAR